MILLDSNVLIYAVGREHPLKRVALDVVELADRSHMRVTPRVLEEFAHVHARSGRSRAIAVDLAGEWSITLGPLEHASEEDVSEAFSLWATASSLDLADALLAAMAMRHDAQLLSADRGFADVAGVRYLDLADPDLRDRLM